MEVSPFIGCELSWSDGDQGVRDSTCHQYVRTTDGACRIYQEIGPGQRIALSKLAVDTFEQKGRPLRLAIDISIWLFQIQSGKGIQL